MAGRALLERIDAVGVVGCFSWRYANPCRRLAESLGLGARLEILTGMGGESPQLLVNDVAGRIRRGELRAVLLAGAEARGVVVRASASYIPAAEGSQVAPASSGFVVARELLRVGREGAPAEHLALSEPGTTLTFGVGDVVEEHVQIVNPKERNYVAIVVPLAAGMEPLNPRLATAPPEASPAGRSTREPSYAAYLDDQVALYFDTLPAGTYDFYFRTRATTPGRFIQPPARAEMMYDAAVSGHGAGARIVVERR